MARGGTISRMGVKVASRFLTMELTKDAGY